MELIVFSFSICVYVISFVFLYHFGCAARLLLLFLLHLHTVVQRFSSLFAVYAKGILWKFNIRLQVWLFHWVLVRIEWSEDENRTNNKAKKKRILKPATIASNTRSHHSVSLALIHIQIALQTTLNGARRSKRNERFHNNPSECNGDR